MNKMMTALIGSLMTITVQAQTFNFSFDGRDKTATKVNATDVFTEAKGYGYDFIDIITEAKKQQTDTYKLTDGLFYFSVAVPDGNYKVTVTVGSKKRMIGNYKFRCGEESGGSVVVGFENHSGKTRLGSGLRPLGKVLAGFGNNGEDGTEGAHYLNVFGTYSHGPLLPKNPAFCDLLLQTALERKYGRAELSPLDDRAENAAHDEMCARLKL